MRSTRRRSSRRPRVSRGIPNRIRNDLHGSKTSPRADPPEITRQPWNTLTIANNFTQTTLGTPVTFTPNSIGLALLQQVGLPTAQAFEIRVQSIAAWDLSGTSIGVRPFDLLQNGSSTNGNPLTVLTDKPGRNRWAKVGYFFPNTQRNNTLISTDNVTTVFQLELSAAASNGAYHLRILWRPTTDLAPTLFSRPSPAVLPDVLHIPYTALTEVSNEVQN